VLLAIPGKQPSPAQHTFSEHHSVLPHDAPYPRCAACGAEAFPKCGQCQGRNRLRDLCVICSRRCPEASILRELVRAHLRRPALPLGAGRRPRCGFPSLLLYAGRTQDADTMGNILTRRNICICDDIVTRGNILCRSLGRAVGGACVWYHSTGTCGA
jgi:hypothetical protein